MNCVPFPCHLNNGNLSHDACSRRARNDGHAITGSFYARGAIPSLSCAIFNKAPIKDGTTNGVARSLRGSSAVLSASSRNCCSTRSASSAARRPAISASSWVRKSSVESGK